MRILNILHNSVFSSIKPNCASTTSLTLFFLVFVTFTLPAQEFSRDIKANKANNKQVEARDIQLKQLAYKEGVRAMKFSELASTTDPAQQAQIMREIDKLTKQIQKHKDQAKALDKSAQKATQASKKSKSDESSIGKQLDSDDNRKQDTKKKNNLFFSSIKKTPSEKVKKEEDIAELPTEKSVSFSSGFSLGQKIISSKPQHSTKQGSSLKFNESVIKPNPKHLFNAPVEQSSQKEKNSFFMKSYLKSSLKHRAMYDSGAEEDKLAKKEKPLNILNDLRSTYFKKRAKEISETEFKSRIKRAFLNQELINKKEEGIHKFVPQHDNLLEGSTPDHHHRISLESSS